MKTPLPSEQVVDDSALLADRLVRSLHRNADGHLAGDQYTHDVEKQHNVGILYIYTHDRDGLYSLQEHYVYVDKAHSYKEWLRILLPEARRVSRRIGKPLHGVYGWNTSYIQITPLRTGDLFITIDDKGARGVRLAFGPSETKRKARKG